MRTTLILAGVFLFVSDKQLAMSDPLPSWNEGAAKESIITFVEKVSDSSSEHFVPTAERIAVFDNDGTLWCETPVPPQADFAAAEVKRLLSANPDWIKDPAIQALLKGDFESLGSDHKGLLSILAKAHAGRSPEDFIQAVSEWLKAAKHPRFNRPYNETVFQPMLEVLTYLRDNGFKTYIVSGGGQDFMRVFSEDTYGIIPEQVIGTYSEAEYETKDDKPTFTKTMGNLFIDDKNGKPEAIRRFIGRRPIACFGNSDGDQAMLEYTTLDNHHPSFGLIVHHTDAEREYAYDDKPIVSGQLISGLDAAKKHGWTIVDMSTDWRTVFP